MIIAIDYGYSLSSVRDYRRGFLECEGSGLVLAMRIQTQQIVNTKTFFPDVNAQVKVDFRAHGNYSLEGIRSLYRS